MSFIIWAAIGLTAGFVGRELAQRSGRSRIPDILFGLFGGLTGGYLYYRFGPAAVNGLNVVSYLAAAVGAVVLMLSLYAFRAFSVRVGA
jgi:uncharacterized membrane protein YeaQ/YmgE (transglycosylase-associated protein family)